MNTLLIVAGFIGLLAPFLGFLVLFVGGLFMASTVAGWIGVALIALLLVGLANIT